MSTTTTKRAWKLQEFIAHGAQVNCVGLGHKSGRVLVTGGDDKKVNLWAVGKPNCIMSLTGHTAPVDSVRFGHTEEMVCAGSQAGTIKLWDLEAARLVRTHTGHKASAKCIEFHPYGQYLASGSQDTSIKLWDTRRKGCIMSYKGHTQPVNAIKFSPDGQWIASAGEDGIIKMWDLPAGKMLTEFKVESDSAVTDVEFHPREFLLAAGYHNRTVCFWDLEKFQLIGASERETGPIRCIFFHPEGECMFSGSQDGLRVHGWEPSRTFDVVPMSWGRVADIATAGQQLIGAAHHQQHVAIYVVDLKRVLPFCGDTIPEKDNSRLSNFGGTNNNNDKNVTFRPGQTVRRSFVREKPDSAGGQKAMAQVKISEETSDKSGTEGEDSDAVSHADIPDINKYEDIFRPRNRELNRTPPTDEPFEEPGDQVGGLGSDIDMPMPVRAVDPMNFHARGLSSKKVSPSPTRRASQPAMSSTGGMSSTPGGPQLFSGRRGSTSSLAQAADPMKPQELHARTNAVPPGSARPYSVAYDPREAASAGGGSGPHSRSASSHSVPREMVGPTSNNNLNPPLHTAARASYRTAVNLQATRDMPPDQEYLPPGGGSNSIVMYPSVDNNVMNSNNYGGVPYNHPADVAPSSPVKQPYSLGGGAPVKSNPGTTFYGSSQYPTNSGGGGTSPLDRPTVVRPNRVSESNANYRLSSYGNFGTQASQIVDQVEDKMEFVPSMSDRPTGLNPSDFMPQKFGGLKIGFDSASSGSTFDHSPRSGGGGAGSGGFDWPTTQLSESEVTSAILKDHTNIMAILTQRGRNMEIIQKLWHSKDAKTAVEKAVEFNDPAIVVDLLSVIILRPSIWNLDLCLHLLPPIGELLLSKYESYVTGAAAALKLVLKNFGSVIKSNIDTPATSVGVDISKEERLNKCMDCYGELVKIRSTILKRQTVQGKCGHAFRELAILMQCLD